MGTTRAKTTKRGHGAGTVSAIAGRPNAWRFQVLVNGKRLGCVWHGTKRDADAALAKWVAGVHAAPAEHATPAAMTLGHVVTAWLEHVAALGNLKPQTLRQYEAQARRMTERLGGLTLRKLTPEAIDRATADIRTTCGPATARLAHARCKAAVAFAVNRGWISDNPYGRSGRPPVKVRTIEPPTDAQVSAILRHAAEDDGTRLLVSLAVATGGRVGELTALRWADVELPAAGKAPRVWFRATLVQRVGGGVTVQPTTKTGKARAVTIDVDTAAELRAWHARAAATALACGVALDASAFVFTGDADGATPNLLTTTAYRWAQARKAAGAEAVRFHDLRHYAATTWLGLGVDVRTVAGRLGHVNPSVTLNVYAAFVPNVDEAAAVAIGQALRAVRLSA